MRHLANTNIRILSFRAGVSKSYLGWCLFFLVKLYWNTVTPICIVCGFQATIAELSNFKGPSGPQS